MSAAVIATILGVVLIGAELFSWLVPRTNNDKTTILHLKKSPNQVNRLDITYLIGLIAWKHLIPSFCGYSPPLKKDPATTQGFSLPEIRTEGLLDISDTHIKVFNDAVLRRDAASSSDEVNAFFLIAQTVPIAIHILANRNGPIKPFGAVNTKNTFRFVDPRRTRDLEALKAASRDDQLSYAARFGGPKNPGHRRKRGVEFQINITVSYHGAIILDQDLWFLQFLPESFEPRYQEVEAVKVSQTALLENGTIISDRTLALNTEDPQRWAASSKDYNPIHVSLLGAKLFGFRTVIAHGNHVAALVMQSLRNETNGSGPTEDASAIFWDSNRAFELNVSFLRPVLLPAQLSTRFAESDKPDRVNMKVVSQCKVCLEASLALVENS